MAYSNKKLSKRDKENVVIPFPTKRKARKIEVTSSKELLEQVDKFQKKMEEEFEKKNSKNK
ncbi:hypothetical protein VBD025_00845 [Virgibacillus flavescens]|uniref:hypothetical protein n=1 Tax=Virgibacillus flavescens TaxID=1611422 RepID=UPI003D332230